MEQHRRYKAGKQFDYDRVFESHIRASKILTQPIEQLGMGELSHRKYDVESHLEELQQDLKDFLHNYEFTKQLNYNRGDSTVEDNKTKERRQTLEALVDVAKTELTRINEAIQTLNEEKEEKNHPPPLPYGPRGFKKVSGYTGHGNIDFQLVEPVDGIPCIKDNRSRYNGMGVFDYMQHVVKPWLRDCAKKKSTKVPWPKWPQGVVNHLNGQVVKTPSLKRKT